VAGLSLGALRSAMDTIECGGVGHRLAFLDSGKHYEFNPRAFSEIGLVQINASAIADQLAPMSPARILLLRHYQPRQAAAIADQQYPAIRELTRASARFHHVA